MLLQFTVENFRSFAGRQVLSMLAVPSEDHPPGQTVEVPGIGRVLRTAVLYGANASGKSSLVLAFKALRSLVVHGVRPGSSPAVASHKLDPDLFGKPTRFELEFVVDGAHYAYGILAGPVRVVQEWLVRVEGGSDTEIFTREDGGGARPRIEIGSGVEISAERLQFLKFVAEGTRPEQPFLAELRERNATELSPILDFFFWSDAEETIEWRESVLTSLLLVIPRHVERCTALLREADCGVTALRIVADTPEIQERIDAGLKFSEVESASLTEGPEPRVRLGFVHQGTHGTTTLAYADLSDGTRRLIRLASVFGFDSATAVFVDELDRSLHTSLTRHLMTRVNQTPGRSQFIFTTHDTNLLDAGVFGRDAIWFVERDAAGASHLTNLASFAREQLDALTGHLEEGYLQGRFGAIPFIGEPRRLGWATP